MEPAKTRRGDREGRRRDILHAASQILVKRGYSDLNMRDVARDAGVSAGTLYSYFATKEEIFETLLIQRYGDVLEAIEAVEVDRPADIEGLLQVAIPAFIETYRVYGRHFSAWRHYMASNPGEAPKTGVGGELLDAYMALKTAFERCLRATAKRQGISAFETPVEMAYVWVIVGGMSEHFGNDRHRFGDYEMDDVIRHAARVLATYDRE